MNRIIRENDAVKAAKKAAKAASDAAHRQAGESAGRKAASAAKDAADKAAKAAPYAAKAGSGAKNESRKMILRLTESDLHRIVKESVNRILREGYNKKNLSLNESKTRKRAIRQAIEVGRRTIRGTVTDPIINDYVHDFMDKYMAGCPDYFYAYLPVLVEIAFRSKTRDEYMQVGEVTMELSRIARNPEAREAIQGIRGASTLEDLESILSNTDGAVRRAESIKGTIDPLIRI